MTRPRLLALELTASRAVVRRAAFIAIAVSAAVAAIGYVLPAHRLVPVRSTGHLFDLAAQPGEDAFHSYLADGGPLPLLVLPTVALLALLFMRQRRLGAGMVTGILGAGGAVLSLMPVILVHFLSRYEEGIGQYVFLLGLLALSFASAALFVVEPALYLLERRRIARASRPALLPVARVAT